jgi:prolyl-tRNA synthetase
VIVPIYKGAEQIEGILEKMKPLMEALKNKGYSVKFDDDDTKRSGWKFAEYELKGVPVRVAVGQRDLENNSIEIARRDTGEKMSISLDGASNQIEQLLNDIQSSMLSNARQFRDQHITAVDSYEEFKQILETKGGFISAHWDGTAATEEKIKNETKATIRCIPFDQIAEEGKCMISGQPSSGRVLFAKAY